jgi:NTE family protein
MSAGTVSKLAGKRPAVALVLQGGGALGAYHIGAYQALAEHDLHPDWVSGISIGAINSAVIAGNAPDERVSKLDEMWRAISWPDLAPPVEFAPWRTLHNVANNALALTFGQPNFFEPRPVNPLLVPNAPPQALSFYDTTPMLASGSLPPGFPATKVGANLYWDGGCVSNTPLDAIIDEPNHPHLVVFMIDLWDAA